MEGLDVRHEPHDAGERAYLVVARGEIDVASVATLTEQFDEVLAKGATLIVFDAHDIDFVDSSGLRGIIAATHEVESRGGQFLIEGMSPAMERVLEVTGLLEKYRSSGE